MICGGITRKGDSHANATLFEWNEQGGIIFHFFDNGGPGRPGQDGAGRQELIRRRPEPTWRT